MHPAPALQRALLTLAGGRLILVNDDADRENQCDLMVAAEHVTVEQVASLVRHSTEIVCTPMPAENHMRAGRPDVRPRWPRGVGDGGLLGSGRKVGGAPT